MNASPRFGFAIVYVDDLPAAKRFYTETLGLLVEREAPTFVQFEHFALASDESMDGRRQLELYWLVPDAEAALAELRPRAQVAMDLRSLPFGKVFGLLDPMGQPRYFLELSTARPSRPVAPPSPARV
jgi:catechol 2,3-dioxygenase-like lactoylglutathione lyase family enzyme